VSEYTCPTQTDYDESFHLLATYVQFNPDFTIISLRIIKQVKTDPLTIRIAATFDDLCPIRSMQNYLGLSPHRSGPLFQFSNGKFLTRNDIHKVITAALPTVPNINTHSFRIGGASAALASGASDSTISILGRWSSDC